ncbi:TonB-dependent receptor plug domain-containing protein [Cellulophaga sp. 20_2_10]|uniref:TonB-dependent receptor plug domain-containing protein n=1 Tax=Cellulophaga sp. 20_2_10 TaxID=2942476 RepID=UPI00201A61D7|nr:TonB-dependent receptor plug domain-containing protein [Cellulophaga sp. 20_2_10]MCL5245476.1 TonB-dependent receptor plug domain-containing protein [Cellulophaga sp. 20_2_10]
MKSVKIKINAAVIALLLCMLSANLQAQSNSFTFSKKEGNENFKILKLDINSATTENDLASYIADAKKEKVDLSFNNVERDTKGNITSISAVYKTKDNKTETHKEESAIAINSFYFYVTTSEKSNAIEKIGFRLENKKGVEKALFVVNGQEIDNQFNLDMIDPDEIESINVLKNESATAKYGSKGRNGVIEITLK